MSQRVGIASKVIGKRERVNYREGHRVGESWLGCGFSFQSLIFRQLGGRRRLSERG